MHSLSRKTWDADVREWCADFRGWLRSAWTPIPSIPKEEGYPRKFAFDPRESASWLSRGVSPNDAGAIRRSCHRAGTRSPLPSALHPTQSSLLCRFRRLDLAEVGWRGFFAGGSRALSANSAVCFPTDHRIRPRALRWTSRTTAATSAVVVMGFCSPSLGALTASSAVSSTLPHSPRL